MKKYLLIIIASAAVLAACNHEDAPYVELTPASLEIQKDGGTVTVEIRSNASWTFAGDGQSWYSAQPVTGEGNGTVVLTVDPYTEAAPRTAAFRVSSYGAFQEGTLVQFAPAPPSSASENALQVIRAGGPCTVQLPAGYTFSAEASEDWVQVTGTSTDGLLSLEVSPYAGAEDRTANVTARLTDGTVLGTVAMVQSWRNIQPGELLIEEVFFTGTQVPGSTSTYGDQYIRLTNNTDRTLYADHLAFVISSYDSQASSAGAYWAPPELPEQIGVANVYRIPGKGTDVPVAPGASLILAIDAQDYTADGGVGIDLSKADYEFNDVNEIYPDIDNPDVPDLECWVRSSLTVTTLHNRGYDSYAIVTFPETLTVEQFMRDYPWIGQEDFWFKGTIFRSRDILEGNYVIPNAWVVDGVNCGVEQYFRTLAFNEKVDAGMTGVGEIDNDPERFGKSARRNLSGGKLMDTDNSTNDFVRGAVPSLK